MTSLCRSWAFCLFLAVLWEGNAVSPASGFSYWTWHPRRDHSPNLWAGRPEALCCGTRLNIACLPTSVRRLRGASGGSAVDLRCVGGPQDGPGRGRRNRPATSTPAATGSPDVERTIPEVSRQKYQDAALGGLIAVGQDVPDDWHPGDQFAFAMDSKFKAQEVVVVLMSDGNLKFGKIRERTPSGSFSVAIVENRLGTKHLDLAADKIGKVLPLSQREIQRLSSSNLPSKGSKSTVIKNTGFFSSFRKMVDVDKQSAREETLPFQPMLSRRAAPVASSSTAISPKPEGRVSSVMSGADSGEWGELDGWWRNEKDQTDTFEVLLQRPLGMELDEVDGEGIFVKSLEDGGYAQQAGLRVGDRVMVPGPGSDEWRDDLVSILSAISGSTGNRLRLRYVRSAAASRAAASLAVGDARQQPRGGRQSWRGTTASGDGYGELDVM
jgi:hypothetical protein